MLKAEIGGEEDRIEFEGSFIDALFESTYIIRNLYFHFSRINPLLAMSFKSLIKATVCDDASPVWEPMDVHGGDGIKSVSIHISKDFHGKEE